MRGLDFSVYSLRIYILSFLLYPDFIVLEFVDLLPGVSEQPQ